MNYSALIQNRKSVRAFTDDYVPFSDLTKIRTYYTKSVQRLFPEIRTELQFFGLDARAVLEGAAGYKQFLVGAPQYMVLLSDKHEHAAENAGYIMEDLILMLTDMGLDSCWLSFHDSEHVKAALEIVSDLDVAAIVAFGFGAKTTKRLRLNFLRMGKVDQAAQRQYFSPKVNLRDMVFVDRWGNTDGVEAYIGFYDDLLWEALYAVSLSPSYLNRQPYGFIIHDGHIVLVRKHDDYTDEAHAKLNLGIVLLHFNAVAAQWAGNIRWNFSEVPALELPDGYAAVAVAAV